MVKLGALRHDVPRTLSLAILDLLFAGVEDAPIRVAMAASSVFSEP